MASNDLAYNKPYDAAWYAAANYRLLDWLRCPYDNRMGCRSTCISYYDMPHYGSTILRSRNLHNWRPTAPGYRNEEYAARRELKDANNCNTKLRYMTPLNIQTLIKTFN